jgi:hypothetical protein
MRKTAYRYTYDKIKIYPDRIYTLRELHFNKRGAQKLMHPQIHRKFIGK